jgi:hypothetical protein
MLVSASTPTRDGERARHQCNVIVHFLFCVLSRHCGEGQHHSAATRPVFVMHGCSEKILTCAGTSQVMLRLWCYCTSGGMELVALTSGVISLFTGPHQTSFSELGSLTIRLSRGDLPVLDPEYAVMAPDEVMAVPFS